MPVIIVRIKYHKVSITYSFPFCCGSRGSGIDVMTSARLCTGTTFVLIVLIHSVCYRCYKAKDVLLAGSFWLAALRLDGPITRNITGSFCIVLLVNTAWPSYRHIARSISNKMELFWRNAAIPVWHPFHHCQQLELLNFMHNVTVRQYQGLLNVATLWPEYHSDPTSVINYFTTPFNGI